MPGGRAYLTAVVALAFAVPAQAATGDPEVVLYRASGLVDNTAGGGSSATSFSCTPFSGVSENVRVVVRSQNGTVKDHHTGRCLNDP